jgi:hypothetical protein
VGETEAATTLPRSEPLAQPGEAIGAESNSAAALSAPVRQSTAAGKADTQRFPSDTAGKPEGAATAQGVTIPETTGTTNRLKVLFARIGALDLPRDGYKRYCYRRYRIASMTELSPEQIAEQAQILDSLKRPARLKEFRTVLEGFGDNGQGARGAAYPNAPSLNAAATEAAPVSVRGAGVPAPIPAQATAGNAPAAGGFDLF